MNNFYLKRIQQEKKEYELIALLREYYDRPFQYDFSPSGELKSFVYSKPDASYSLEVLLNKKGGIVTIDPEHKVPKQEVRAIEQYIKDALLDDKGYKVGQTVCFLFGTVERYFTCKYFQLLPVPAHAPKPTMGIRNYPFLLQYLYPTSSNKIIDSMRRQETEQRYLNLLSLFLHTKIKQNPSVFHTDWTFDMTRKLTEERFIGYMYDFESYSSVLDTFSDTSGYQMATLVPQTEYYTGTLAFKNVLNVADTELKLPDNLVVSFEKVDSLGNKDQENFLRACYWLRQAQIQQEVSRSSSLIALVAAIECLIEKNQCPGCHQEIIPSSGRCDVCKEPIYRITAAFKTFVETWFPDAARYPEAIGLLYNTRSTAVHGSGILLSDSHPWIHFTEHKQALDEYDTYERAYLITKVVLYNSLHYRQWGKA